MSTLTLSDISPVDDGKHYIIDSHHTASSSPTGTPTSLPVVDTVPPSHTHRTLVLCFDGTGDQFDADNSNIVEFFRMLKKDDPEQQLVYYQAGIGTYTVPQIVTPFMSRISKTLDMMIAWNLDAHIMGGYEFLMQNYRAHDRICIFGFSRGAYTARCLAGMIHKVGLLPACNHQQVPFAYKMYTQTDENGWKQSNQFKKTFCIDVDIEFLGVWDTVDSVGLVPRRLPFTTSNTVVRTFRHAVALDERRAKFKANLWNKPNDKEKLLSVSDQHVEKEKKKKKNENSAKQKMKALERKYTKDVTIDTDVEEVWFAGCHCDIGGGSVANGVRPCLARIPLRWMIRECFKTDSGILFHTDGFRNIGIDYTSLYPVVLPRPPALPLDNSAAETSLVKRIPKKPEQPAEDDLEHTVLASSHEPSRSEELSDLHDALAPIYDQLKIKWFWWFLELIPLRFRYQDDNKSWVKKFTINWGRGRHIPKKKKNGIKIHRSVKARMEAVHEDGTKYVPNAPFDLENHKIIWVD